MSRRTKSGDIGLVADEADRFPLFAAEIRGEGEAERLPLFADDVRGENGREDAEQIRENQPADVESAGKEAINDGISETGIKSIRQGEVREREGGVSAPSGRGDQGDSARRGRGGEAAARGDDRAGGRLLGDEGADTARPEPGVKSEAEERPEYVDAADPSRTKTQLPSAARKLDDYEITNPDALVPSGKKSKLDANFAAIGLLKELQAEGRTPTRGEQDILARFVGWGQFPALFNDINDAGEQLAEEREELKRLLGERDYDRAKASTINAHYTAPKIVQKMWDVARRLGFKGGRVLEPGMGVGYFYGLMPRDLMAQSKLAGVELDPTSGAIARLLYPNASINIKGFQEVKIADGFYDLVITNVPFSENSPFDPEYRNLRAPLHDYYLIKSLDKVRESGLVIAITSSYTLDKAETRFRREMAKRGDLVAAFRFPDTAFKANAGTEVVTDLLIFQKRMAGEKAMGESASSDYLPAIDQLQAKGWYQSARQRLDVEGQPIIGMAMGVEIDRIQYQCEWKGQERLPDSDIRSLRESGWYKESQNVWVTPLVKYGQSSDWTKLGELPDPDGGDPIPINNYYVQNPDHILGILDRKSKLYRPDDPHVSGTSDFDERFERAISSLPENIFGESQTRAIEPEAVADAVRENVVEGGYILRDGRILQRQGDVFVVPNFTPAEEAKAKLLISVRDALNELNVAQLKGGDTAEPRRAVNKAYDHFILWHGPISKATNRKLLIDDPSSYLLLALETSYDTKRQKATKADIFFKDTIARTRQAKDVSTPAAAVAVNLFETGRVDVDRIAELLKTTPEEAGRRLVADGLAYENPRGAWERAEEYLSGSVRKKLVEARSAADVDGKFASNVEALEKVQPADVPMDQINVKLGANWVPAQDIANFAGHLMQTDPSGFRIHYAEGPGIWTVSWGSTGLSQSSLAREVYGTARADFVDVLDAALNDRPIKLYDRDADGNSYLDKEASDAANEKVKEVREKFADWLWTDDERAKRLHRYYNDNFNNLRVTEYTGAHYANEEGKYILPGMNPGMSLRPNQVKDVWQAVANGKLLDASEVGAGKTFILGTIAMEWRRVGIAKKPAISVPKPRIAATVAELQLLYPAAKILSLEKSFDKENRKRTTAQMATGDYDMVVLSHEQLDKMPMSPAIVNEFIGAELEEIEERIREAQAVADEEGDSRAGNRIVKRLEKIKERVEAKLQEALDATNKDDVVYFEETGIDALLVDEAHAFKSLPVYSRRSELKGVPSTRSDRATSMYMRTRWLMSQNNNKGVVFATGTPLTNTLAEIYNMQRFLQPELLEERGISNFDDWMNLFADASTDFEYKASGAYEPVTRLTEFVNLPELQQMFRQNMATNFVDDMPWVVRPKKIENVITSPMTEEQLAYLQTIRQRVEALKHMSPRERKESRENFLLISTDARKSALSPRLVNYRATESGGKIEKVAEKVLEIHRARPGVSQMIFLDYGVNQNDWGYSVYDDIQNRLTEGGISIEKIANFGRMSDGARQKAAEKLNTGEYLIGIGSSGKMGTGINAQKRLAAMHHVDAPWLPAFVEQRNGRGHRQGNINDPTKPAEEQTVEAYYYTTEGSFDVVMWQALTRKSKFIEQFMRGDMSVREMRFDDTGDEETGEIGPEMILAATSGNPYELDRVRLIKDIERLDKQARNHRQQQSRFRTQIAEGGRRRAELEQEIEEYGKDTAHYEVTKGQKFSATFNGKTYDDRKVAGNQLAVAAVELPPRSNVKIGQYRGFDIYIDKGKERADGVWHLDAYLQREDGLPYSFDLNLSEPEGAFNSADANLRYASSHKAKSEERLASLERDVETAKAEVDKPFRRAEELEQKRQKLREIQRSIEELYDQKPGRDVRKLASRLETMKPVMTFVQGGAYDIAEIRQSMADVAPNKAAFDRWLLALQNSGIVQLHEHDDIARRGNPEAYVHDHKTGRYYSDLMMKQGWEPKAANVPPITAFIEAEAQTEGHINGYDLEEVVMLEMAKSAELAQQAYGELYAEQQAQAEGGASASIGERLKIDGISLEARKHAEDLVSHWTDFANDRTDFQTLAENSHVEYVRDPQNARAGIIYMNGHARRFYELILSEETEKDVSFAVLATPGHSLVEHQKLLDKYMVTYTANSDAVRAMNAIKEAISLAQTDGVDGVIFFDVHLPGEYWEQASAHEGFHVWQYGAPELSDGWVERQPGYDQIRAELLARNYEDDPAAIAREWAAYAVTDDLERFGFTRDEGARFLHAYFSEIINQGGIDAMDRVGNVSPRAQSIIETKRWRHARNQSQSQRQARTEAGGPGASLGPETSEITTGRGPAGDRISLQGRSGNGRERGGRAPYGAEVGRDQLAESTEALKPVRYYEAQGFIPINPASGLHLDARLAEQGFSNENTIQRRDATTEALMTALQTISNIEAPDPSGRRSLKELSATVGRIALAALADAGGAEAIQDKEVGAALGKIAGIMASDQQGRLLSLQERIDDAVKIARAAIEEIESRMLAQNVTVNAAEMAQPQQPSTHGQGIGW